MSTALLSRLFVSSKTHFVSQPARPFSQISKAFFIDSEREKLAGRVDDLSKQMRDLEDMMQASLTLTLKSAITIEVMNSRLEALINEVRTLRHEQRKTAGELDPLRPD